ncbi:hypothetical protein scyTo_0020207 [Scyliorhinus torazame]|uniref:Uncharacterized protein n=1 Tax=Scyliorhinus torazame TaxID=75743 RepID=A0A401Q231_SCYTO|nr:hypothetical protein [Scyliorhinus torazame]
MIPFGALWNGTGRSGIAIDISKKMTSTGSSNKFVLCQYFLYKESGGTENFNNAPLLPFVDFSSIIPGLSLD